MTSGEALDFVFKSTKLAKGGEIFISKMPVIRMGDLAEVMIDMYASDKEKTNIKIELIGSQPGEKIYEELMTDEEVTRAVELDDMFVLKPQIPDLFTREYNYQGQKKPRVGRYTSLDEKIMSRVKLKKLLEKIDMEQ